MVYPPKVPSNNYTHTHTSRTSIGTPEILARKLFVTQTRQTHAPNYLQSQAGTQGLPQILHLLFEDFQYPRMLRWGVEFLVLVKGKWQASRSKPLHQSKPPMKRGSKHVPLAFFFPRFLGTPSAQGLASLVDARASLGLESCGLRIRASLMSSILRKVLLLRQDKCARAASAARDAGRAQGFCCCFFCFLRFCLKKGCKAFRGG